MKKFKKVITAIAVAFSVAAVSLFGGCFSSDSTVVVKGKDGQDVSIYDIYDATKEETNNPDLTFDEFLKEYLSYDSSELQQAASKQAIVNQCMLSTVSIISEFTETVTSFGYPYGVTSKKQSVSYAGAGVIIDIDKEKGDMYVVTNCHVVYSSSSDDDHYCDDISVYLYGGEYLDSCKMTAEIVGATKQYDIAVLKITDSDIVKNSNAEKITWDTNEECYVGETVYAIGNPKGEKMSVTEGIISRDSEYITIDLENTTSTTDDYTYRVVRTDAAINGGNSGGGLYTTEGKLIGIVNAKSVSDDIDNMGYALPAATTRRVVQNILDNYTGTETHGITRAYAGITTKIVTSTATYNNTKNVTEIYEDVGISSVSSDGVFYRELREDDIVTKVVVTSSDGTEKENINVIRHHNISDVLLSVRVGDSVTITVNRNGEELSYTKTYSLSDMTTEV